MLQKITSPDDIKNCTIEEIKDLAGELREKILSVVSENGGHLGSNLGMVELTLAIHRVFDSPRDSIVFDVGHQCYAHKLLTGRYADFHTLRKFRGISGFPNPQESPHDSFISGHSGSSIAAAIGLAQANKLLGNKNYAVAVVGDGSFTNGMIYEALNNCDDKALNLIIILNDNEMSISPNVGGLSRYFSRIRTSRRYFALKHRTKHFLGKFPGGKRIISAARAIKNFVKRIFLQKNLFECFGLKYLGPVNGHDQEHLEEVLREAKKKERICIVHAITQKGKGYIPAEMVPAMYHGVSPFDLKTGVPCNEKESFSAVFGELLCDLAEKDPRICAVTAAMCEGTGLSRFREKYPERFFDTGIAEEYAVAFCGGLLKKGYRPVCVLYSTFAQRVYDQMLHDIVLQKQPMILALDRAGLVPGDGITHQGIFDVSIFSSIPGVVIYAPETYEELKEAFSAALGQNVPVVIRYAKGAEKVYDHSVFRRESTMDVVDADSKKAVITYGRLTENVLKAVGDRVKVIKLKQLIPLDRESILAETEGIEKILVIEEGIRSGGIGEKIAALFADQKKIVGIHAIETFPEHGDLDALDREFGFDRENLEHMINNF